MRRIFWILWLCAFIFFSNPAMNGSVSASDRGMFVSVIQEPPVLSSKEEIKKLVEFSKQARIKILFVQIYRAGKAWFPSQIADAAPYEANLKSVGEDSFQYLIKEAHAAGIHVHAWLNLLSLSTNQNALLLKKYGPEILTRNTKNKKTIEDYKIDNQYFLEPGDLRVREALVKMVGEILTAYPALDGIQFDYIRYPDQNPHYGYTEMNVSRFKEVTGLQAIDEESKIWKDWKRAQVTELLEQLISAAKKIRPKITISTTGCMSYIRAYHEAFQDWPSWVNRGLIDFVTIMSYEPVVSEFQKQIHDAEIRVNDFKKVNIGLGAYELIHSPKHFREQLELCEESGGGACVFFHYGSLLESRELHDFVAS